MRNVTKFFGFVICLLLFSCSTEEVKESSKFVIPEQYHSFDFTKEKSSGRIKVETNIEPTDWNVTSDKEWCMVSKSGSSEIQLLVLENQERDVREATVSIKSSVENYEIKVKQLGYGPAILLSKNKFDLTNKEQEITLTVTSNINYEVKIDESNDWILPVQTRALVDTDHQFTIRMNEKFLDRVDSIMVREVDNINVKAVCVVTQKSNEGDISDIIIEGDISIVPTGGWASENQPGQGIDKCFDGIMGQNNGFYHSVWSQSAKFPVVLEFNFEGKEAIDYLIYHSRGGNGNFGELKIYTQTAANPEYALQGEYDFRMQNSASRVEFATPVQATKIKFEVYSGAGKFVSCDEMQFFKKNTDKSLDAGLLKVFTDLSCSELLPNITDKEIYELPGFFASIATRIKSNTYNKEFRITDYKPYSSNEIWADKLMTKRYTGLDNPTGITAKAGDSLFVLVGNTHGNRVTLQCVAGVDASGDSYFLEEGVNKIGIRRDGMLFLIYQTDLTSPNAKPIRVHIPEGCGNVDGYFDLELHKTNEKYADVLKKSTYKYFCVKGERIMFYFHRSKMLEVVPNEILLSINLWDNLIRWQQDLMGLEDLRPSQVNNHIMAISPEDGYMWASDYRIGFVYTYLHNILIPDNVMAAKDNVWGPAHEIGHIHQKAINWPGSTESSNNLFSNYSLYKLGKYCSRGSELSELAMVSCVNQKPWYDFGDGHQGENTELHMRMNWQLWNYYHRCGYKTNFWPTLFKRLREDRINESDPGDSQLKFARLASEVANEDLTEFFEMWGFFRPVDTTIDQYGSFKYTVTTSMINATKSFMARFPKPKHAFYYLEDRKNGDVGIDGYRVGDTGYYTLFKENKKITKEITYTQSGRNISIRNGEEAVAFEVKRGSSLLYFSNFFAFEVPEGIDLATSSLFAVQADGTRIAMKKGN